MNLRNAWYMVTWSKELVAGAPVATSVLGESITLRRGDDGSVRALDDHSGLRVYPTAERHSAVWIWMGKPERADVGRIVDFVGPDHPDWAMLPGRMDYDADYRLIQDNLLDLTHVPYVHRSSFGRGDARINDAWIRAEVHVTPLEDGVRVLRWVAGTPASPSLRQPEGTMVDALTAYDYRVPGIFLLTTRHYLAGAAARFPRELPTDIEPLFTTFSCQAVTPLDARRTCYHFAYGPSRKHPGAEAMKDGFATLALKAFNEDKVLIEAQQQIIDADPSRRMVMLDFDRSPVMYNRLVAKLMAEEAAER
jgi:vanillate O-demethylase monooxygenase subunit